MARYIDADALEFEEIARGDIMILKLNESLLVGARYGNNIKIVKGFFKEIIETASTCDVVPRSEVEKAKLEVAREIFEEIEKIIDEKYNRFVFKPQQYDSDEELETIINYSDVISDSVAELKKKYEIGE